MLQLFYAIYGVECTETAEAFHKERADKAEIRYEEAEQKLLLAQAEIENNLARQLFMMEEESSPLQLTVQTIQSKRNCRRTLQKRQKQS